MRVKAIKTEHVRVHTLSLAEVVDRYIDKLSDRSVVAITSKLVSICEGRVRSMETNDLENLVRQEADYYLKIDKDTERIYTLTRGTLILRAGIDKNSSRGYYILWPADPQHTANTIRQLLCDKFDHQDIGVIITDSITTPLRHGVSGISLAQSGFQPVRKAGHGRVNVAGGLAAAAVLTMGEGSENTPLAIIDDIDFVDFTRRDPSAEEIDSQKMSLEFDIYGHFLAGADWQKGGRGTPGET